MRQTKRCKNRRKTITQLDIKEFKEEQEKVIDLTANEGPETYYVNIKNQKSFNQKEEKLNDKVISGPTSLVTIILVIPIYLMD